MRAHRTWHASVDNPPMIPIYQASCAASASGIQDLARGGRAQSQAKLPHGSNPRHRTALKPRLQSGAFCCGAIRLSCGRLPLTPIQPRRLRLDLAAPAGGLLRVGQQGEKIGPDRLPIEPHRHRRPRPARGALHEARHLLQPIAHMLRIGNIGGGRGGFCEKAELIGGHAGAPGIGGAGSLRREAKLLLIS